MKKILLNIAQKVILAFAWLVGIIYPKHSWLFHFLMSIHHHSKNQSK